MRSSFQHCNRTVMLSPLNSEQPNSHSLRRTSHTLSFFKRQNLRWASVWFNDVFLMTAGVICIRANRALLQCSGWFNDVGCRNKFIFGNCQKGVLTELTMACCLSPFSFPPTLPLRLLFFFTEMHQKPKWSRQAYDASNAFPLSFYIQLL